MRLILRPVTDNYIPQLTIWLNKEHVQKWYHDPNEWLKEIRGRHDHFHFLNHFVVLKDSEPIGFAQYYDCFDAKEEWYVANKPGEFFSIDYFIGEEVYLQKGYGKMIVKLLVNEIECQYPKPKIIVQPENENIASCKTLLANNFTYDIEKCYYILENKL